MIRDSYNPRLYVKICNSCKHVGNYSFARVTCPLCGGYLAKGKRSDLELLKKIAGLCKSCGEHTVIDAKTLLCSFCEGGDDGNADTTNQDV